MLQVVYEGHRYHFEKTPTKIIMTVPDGATEDNREKAMTEWYRSEMKRILPGVLEQCEERVGVTFPKKRFYSIFSLSKNQ